VELTAQERTKIKQRENGLNYPDELYPFKEDRIEALSSVGLRYEGEVVGWSIFHRVTPSFVIYKSLFVKPELRSIGLGVHLFVASANRQLTDEKVTEAMFIVLKNNTAMVRFVNRHITPYLTAINNFWKSSKLLRTSTVIELDRSTSHSSS
jgi:hypothetical protein